jgi:Raf kinase inhibitor-like YbhB/YbcL family protein
MYGIPATVTGLASGVPADAELKSPISARQGMTDFRRVGYGGPCPPPGPAHRYVFTLYALSETLKLPAGATKTVLLEAVKKVTLEQAVVVGMYGRGGKAERR